MNAWRNASVYITLLTISRHAHVQTSLVSTGGTAVLTRTTWPCFLLFNTTSTSV